MTSAICFLLCEDDYFLNDKAKILIAKEATNGLVPEVIDGRVDTVEAAVNVINQTINAVQSTDLFSSDKIVWLKDATFLGHDRTMQSETTKEALETFKALLSRGSIPGVFFLVSTSAFNKVSSFYKGVVALSKSGTISFEELPWGKAGSKGNIAILKDFVKEQCKVLNFNISSQVIDLLVQYTGENPRSMISELNKLYSYTNGASPTIEDLRTIVSVNIEEEPWDLLDMFGERNAKETLDILHNLYEQRLDPVFLVMQLESRINDLVLVCDCLNQGILSQSFSWTPSAQANFSEYLDKLGKFDPTKKGWIKGKLISQASKWNRMSIRRARKVMNQAHERIVSIGANPKDVLEIAIISAISS